MLRPASAGGERFCRPAGAGGRESQRPSVSGAGQVLPGDEAGEEDGEGSPPAGEVRGGPARGAPPGVSHVPPVLQHFQEGRRAQQQLENGFKQLENVS